MVVKLLLLAAFVQLAAGLLEIPVQRRVGGHKIPTDRAEVISKATSSIEPLSLI